MTTKLDVTQPTPCDLPSPEAIANLEEWKRYRDEQDANRKYAVGRLLSLAIFIRKNGAKLSPETKDYLLSSVVRIADEFLEGR